MTTARELGDLGRGRIPQFDTSDLYTRMWLARETAGLSLQDLSDITGVHRTTLSNYETGVTPPTHDLLLAWAKGCDGTDAQWLIGDYVKPARKPRRRLPTQPYVAQYLEFVTGGRQISAPRTGHLSLVLGGRGVL